MTGCILFTPNSKAADLQTFFEVLAAQRIGQPAPTYEETLQVIDQIQNMDSAKLSLALPAIFEALKMSAETPSINAAFALTAIARRLDSGSILKPYTQNVADMLSTSDVRLNGAAMLIFEQMRPALPKQTEVPLLLTFLSSSQGALQAKPGAIGILLKLSPNDPAITQAIVNFMSRPLDIKTRIDACNAIGNAGQNNTVLSNMVLAMLAEPDPYVKKAAIQSIQRMGPAVVARAQPLLLQLANDPSQARDLRKRADQALGLNNPLFKDVP